MKIERNWAVRLSLSDKLDCDRFADDGNPHDPPVVITQAEEAHALVSPERKRQEEAGPENAQDDLPVWRPPPGSETRETHSNEKPHPEPFLVLCTTRHLHTASESETDTGRQKVVHDRGQSGAATKPVVPPNQKCRNMSA